MNTISSIKSILLCSFGGRFSRGIAYIVLSSEFGIVFNGWYAFNVNNSRQKEWFSIHWINQNKKKTRKPARFYFINELNIWITFASFLFRQGPYRKRNFSIFNFVFVVFVDVWVWVSYVHYLSQCNVTEEMSVDIVSFIWKCANTKSLLMYAFEVSHIFLHSHRFCLLSVCKVHRINALPL